MTLDNPFSSKERFIILDALRKVALLGICLTITWSFCQMRSKVPK